MEENTDFMWNSPSFFPPTKIFNPKKHQRFPPCTKSCLSRNNYKESSKSSPESPFFSFEFFQRSRGLEALIRLEDAGLPEVATFLRGKRFVRSAALRFTRWIPKLKGKDLQLVPL